MNQRGNMPPGDMSHESIVMVGNMPDTAFLLEFSQPFKRKNDINISISIGVIIIIVSDHKTRERFPVIDEPE